MGAVTAEPASASNAVECASIPERSARLQCFTGVPEIRATVGRVVDGDTAPAFAWLNLSRAHYNCQGVDAAEAVAREGLAKYPDDAALAVDLAGMAMNRKDFPEAVTRWRAVLDSVGDGAAAAIYVKFAISLLVIGELHEAESVVRKAVAKHGNKDLLAAMTQLTQRSTNDGFRDFPVTYAGASLTGPKVPGESCGVARALLTRFLLSRRETAVDLIGFCREGTTVSAARSTRPARLFIFIDLMPKTQTGRRHGATSTLLMTYSVIVDHTQAPAKQGPGDVVEAAEHMIGIAKSPDTLLDLIDRIDQSDKFTDAQKAVLTKKINSRLDECDALPQEESS